MHQTLAVRYPPGQLIHARGRDWVVLPSSDPDLLLLRPLTGIEDEVAGLFLPLEGDDVRPATFPLPDPDRAGDALGALLLTDAARLSLRSGATPFRSLGRIAVRPRPYQFVPLVMALRLDPVRLLIADDVGVGKTIEAALIARELLDRGLARRLAVLCPAHLCDQWEAELRDKFGIDARVVQPARLARLERELPRQDMSVYQYFRYLVCSIDFVKADRHRQAFLAAEPDLVIVDEAHLAARPRGQENQVQHQRHRLLRELAADPRRHLLLVTATPHSGIEESYRSLLGLLHRDFDPNPGEPLDRSRLLPHVVQRRRPDLQHWLGTETPFPERRDEERTYQLSPVYRALFEDVLNYCRETVSTGQQVRSQQQRVRHWAAIAILRCVLSSPPAAAAVLSHHAERKGYTSLLMEDASPEDADALYRPQVMDVHDEEASSDYAPAAPVEDAAELLDQRARRQLASFLRRALDLHGPEHDRKLVAAAEAIGELLGEGYRPIVFCRFIPTAKYLQTQLPKLLEHRFPGLRVIAVTGEVGDEERRTLVEELVREPVRVLVATDCLSEGINLQEHFDAVLHYDLPWNPNRLEQRNGRVDRFGQSRPVVRTVVLYGADNDVDLVVLHTLINKSRAIRRQLGISVPVPVNTEAVLEAVLESVLLRQPACGPQLQLALESPKVAQMDSAWEEAARREGEQRAFFAQHGIQPDVVARELEATDPVLGDSAAVERFLRDTLQRFGGSLRPAQRAGAFEMDPGELRPRLEQAGFAGWPRLVRFDGLADPDALALGRNHPVVAAICDAVLARALGPSPDPRFARCGALFTDAVERRTVVLLLRLRYRLEERVEQFAEEVLLAAFRRQDGRIDWLQPVERRGRELLERARPVADISQEERRRQVAWALGLLQEHPDWYEPVVNARVAELEAAHARLRQLTGAEPLQVEPHRPPDVLGCYVLLPATGR